MKKLCILLSALLLLTALTGCGSRSGETASVQSVAMICGLDGTGLAERFAGVVCARSEVEVKADENKTISEIKVAVGDDVKVGQVLFTYDLEASQLNLEKAQLELEQMQNTVASKEAEKEELEKEKAKASSSDQLSYTLEIEECDTAIREQNYNISLKEKEVARMEESVSVVEYTSPIDGRVKTLNESGTDDTGAAASLMTLIETGTYRVEGQINENNVNSLPEGTKIIVRSRMDETQTWTGEVSMIDWNNPVQSTNSYYYTDSGDSMTTSSKYPFYVELDNADGLLLGQHVYIEPDLGTGADGLQLASWYLFDIDDDSASVWAENSRGKLEKRTVTLGGYDETTDCYTITDGLTTEDYIAFPDDSLSAGMTCVEYDESAFSDDGSYDEGSYEDYDYTDEYTEEYEYSEDEVYTDETYTDEAYSDAVTDDADAQAYAAEG